MFRRLKRFINLHIFLNFMGLCLLGHHNISVWIRASGTNYREGNNKTKTFVTKNLDYARSKSSYLLASVQT